MTNVELKSNKHVRAMGVGREKSYSRPASQLGELRDHDGQRPSVDLTREPWLQPVRRWGLSGGAEHLMNPLAPRELTLAYIGGREPLSPPDSPHRMYDGSHQRGILQCVWAMGVVRGS